MCRRCVRELGRGCLARDVRETTKELVPPHPTDSVVVGKDGLHRSNGGHQDRIAAASRQSLTCLKSVGDRRSNGDAFSHAPVPAGELE